MVNADNYFSGNWITAEIIKENPELLKPLTVLAVKIEEMKDKTTKVNVIFDGFDESLLLNKTNYLMIKDSLGSETDNWIGAKITLALSKEMFQGKRVDAVRIVKVVTP